MLAGNATAEVEGSEPSAIVEMGGAGIDSMKQLRRDLIDSERLKQYVFAHPSLTPDVIEDKACVCTPSLFRSTTAPEKWRNTVREYCLRWPNVPIGRAF